MKACSPFRFFTSSILVELTGKKAYHLKDFIEILKTIDESSIFYHVHHAFREYQFAPGTYTNDFAYWFANVLGEFSLAERLANINIQDYATLADLRKKLIEVIEGYLNQAVEIRKAPPDKAFYFCQNRGVIVPTKYEAWNLDEFCSMLKKVGMRSIFFHFFEARLRLNRKTSDFSEWLRNCFGERERILADKIDKLDPYLLNPDELRDEIIKIIQGKTLIGKVKKWLKLN